MHLISIFDLFLILAGLESQKLSVIPCSCKNSDEILEEVPHEKAYVQISRPQMQGLSALSGDRRDSQSDPLLRRIQAQKAKAIPKLRSSAQNSQVVSKEVVAYDLPDLWFCR